MNYQKKRNLLKVIAAVGISVSMSVVICMTGFAAAGRSTDITPLSISARQNVTLSISSGTATSSVKVSATAGEVTKISITMDLQKKSSSGSYSTVKTWSGSKSSNYYNFKRTKSVSKGTYRVKARITCSKGSTSETITKFSNAKTY